MTSASEEEEEEAFPMGKHRFPFKKEKRKLKIYLRKPRDSKKSSSVSILAPLSPFSLSHV